VLPALGSAANLLSALPLLRESCSNLALDVTPTRTLKIHMHAVTVRLGSALACMEAARDAFSNQRYPILFIYFSGASISPHTRPIYNIGSAYFQAEQRVRATVQDREICAFPGVRTLSREHEARHTVIKFALCRAATP
jgi:hypothetical protein